MLKRAVMAGLNATGITVDDLEVAPVPVTRFQVRSQRSQGGITVRLVGGDPQSVVIRFFDDNGADISEATQRKIERLYYREDFRRVFPGDIGDIGFPPRAIEYYTAALTAAVDVDAVRRARYKVVVDYGFGTTAFVMPTVLSKLGAEVLALNPFATTPGAATYDRDAHGAAVGTMVRSSGASVGVVLDPDGEHVAFIDEEGHLLSHTEALFVFVQLVTTATPGCRIAVPVHASRKLEALVAATGSELVYTKLSTPALMDVAMNEDVAMAASLDGGFIFPDMLPAFDGIGAFVKLLELLAHTGTTLAKAVADVPRVHLAEETVVTPWEQKGAVMRSLVERADRELVLVDGVKLLHDEGWVLALPDPDEPLTHIWAEGGSDAEARRLAQDYARRIRAMQR
jgi:mannose-1-phosphate guanylyltransferase/phosphomannomutase